MGWTIVGMDAPEEVHNPEGVGLCFPECGLKTPHRPKQFNPSCPVLLYIINGHCADFMGAGDLFRFGGDVPGENYGVFAALILIRLSISSSR